jgi:hypothetical protein
MDYPQLSQAQDVDENGLIFDLVTLFVLMVLAKLGGKDKPSWITDWVAERKEQLVVMKILKGDAVPCHMTYRRVLQEIVDAPACLIGEE